MGLIWPPHLFKYIYLNICQILPWNWSCAEVVLRLVDLARGSYFGYKSPISIYHADISCTTLSPLQYHTQTFTTLDTISHTNLPRRHILHCPVPLTIYYIPIPYTTTQYHTEMCTTLDTSPQSQYSTPPYPKLPPSLNSIHNQTKQNRTWQITIKPTISTHNIIYHTKHLPWYIPCNGTM